MNENSVGSQPRYPAWLGPRLRLWLWRVGLVLAILYGGYVLLGNIALNTPLGPWLVNRQPEKFHADWNHGYTLWPGRAHLSGVRAGGHVRRIQWGAQADAVTGHVKLLPLLRRRVHVPQVVADGVEAQLDLVEDRPPPPAGPGGWALQLDHIRTDSFRAVRLGQLRLSGDGVVEAALYKQLRGGAMELMPSSIRITHTQLHRGDIELMRDAVLDAKVKVARHTRSEAAGIDVLRMVDASIGLQGLTSGLKVTAREGTSHVDVAVVPGEGRVSVDLGLTGGALTPGGRADITLPVASTGFDGANHENALVGQLAVDQDLHLSARTPESTETALALDADLTVSGNTLPLDGIDGALARSSGHVIGRWRFESLDWLEVLLPKASLLSLEGQGLVSADVRVDKGALAPGSRIDVPEVSAVATVMGNRIAGQAQVETRFEGDEAGTLRPQLTIRMNPYSVASAESPDAPYIQGQDLRLDIDAGTSLGQLGQAKRAGTLRQAVQQVKARLRFQDARVPDLAAYNRFLPGGQLHLEGGSGTLAGDLELDGAGEVGGGWLKVKSPHARLRLADLALTADLDLNAKLARSSLTEHEFNLAGSRLNLSKVSFREPGGDTVQGWWARIGFDHARVDWSRPMDVSGKANIEMRDMSFVLALYARMRDYPGWISRLIGSGQAQVVGNVAWKGDTLVFDRLRARQGRYELLARLKLQGKRRNGSLYAKWGVLSCAVELDNGKRDFHLVHARRWYDAQPDLMP